MLNQCRSNSLSSIDFGDNERTQKCVGAVRGGRRRIMSGEGLTASLYATFAARFTRFVVWAGTQHSDSLSRQQFWVR